MAVLLRPARSTLPVADCLALSTYVLDRREPTV